MTYKVNITRQAEEDIRGVFEYIAYDLKSVQNALSQLDRIESEILSLDQMPERYRAYEKEPWHSRGLRVMSVDHYLMFYIRLVRRRPWILSESCTVAATLICSSTESQKNKLKSAVSSMERRSFLSNEYQR